MPDPIIPKPMNPTFISASPFQVRDIERLAPNLILAMGLARAAHRLNRSMLWRLKRFREINRLLWSHERFRRSSASTEKAQRLGLRQDCNPERRRPSAI